MMESRIEIKMWGGLTSKKRPQLVRRVRPSGAKAQGTLWSPGARVDHPGTPEAGSKVVEACCLHCRLLSFDADLAYL